MIDDLSATAANLNKTMAAVSSIASDPSVKANLIGATANLRDSSEKLKEVTTQIESITGDPQVQAQLRGAIANLSSATAKANDILSTFSTAGATTSSPNQTRPSTDSGETAAPMAESASGTSFKSGAHNGLDIATAQIRETFNGTPEPMSDLNLELLPRAPVHVTLGANNIGYNTTYNFLVDWRRSEQLQYSFGVLYSNLGAEAKYRPFSLFGIDARVYDPAYPKLDLYGDIHLAQRLELFYGERSLMGPSSTRAPAYGVQFNL
jgi:hypothetical protein